jgi:hypothetical protein
LSVIGIRIVRKVKRLQETFRVVGSSPALLHRLFEHDVHLVKGLCFVWFEDGSETGL